MKTKSLLVSLVTIAFAFQGCAPAPPVTPHPTYTPYPIFTPVPPTPTLIPTTPTPASTRQCRIAYSEKTDINSNDIYVMDCDGSNLRWLTEGRLSSGHEPTWSPDGQRLVFDENSGSPFMPTYLYIVNADGSNRTQITSPEGPVEGDFPSWSPDGTRIAFHSGPGICTIHPDGSNRFCVISFRDLSGAGEAEFNSNKFAWSPDSRRIAFTATPLASTRISPDPFKYRLYVVNADGTGLIKLGTFESHVHNAVSRWPPAWSPDGKQIAVEIALDEMGVVKRYLINSDGSGEMVAIDPIPESWFPWYWPQWDIR